MSDPAVTLVTAHASQDDLSDTDYREIYDELRSKMALRQFVEFIGSAVSIALWSKYEQGAVALSRERKQELRRAIGRPVLPPTLGELAAAADPDAQVWHVGEGRADRLVLIGEAAHDPLTMRLNGSLRIVPDDPPVESHVTGVTGPTTQRTAECHKTHRRAYFRPCLSLDPAARIPQLEALLAEANQKLKGVYDEEL